MDTASSFPNCPLRCREKHMRWLWKQTGNHDDAEDLTQQLCLRCWSERHRLQQPEHLNAWLWRIRKHILDDFWAERYDRREVIETELSEQQYRMAQERAALIQEASALDRQALQEQLEAVLEALPETQARLLVWKYLEGRSCAEIAGRLGIREASVRQALYRARPAFMEAYSKLDEEDL